MSVKILSVTLLLLLVSLQASAKHRYPHKRVSPPCCTSYSTQYIRDRVTGKTYHAEEAAPAYGCLKAILFKVGPAWACANPDEAWVKKLTATMTKE